MCLAGTGLAGMSGNGHSLRDSKFPFSVGLEARGRTAVFVTSIAARLSDGRTLSRDDSERTEGQRLRIGLDVFRSKVPNRNLEVLSSVVF